uniref:MSP domain-containing protein n=1 Tax=Panagrolaimus sp. PS1159 TaxID=55785 RepID=A0AC35EYB1_9BILA
MGSSTTVSSSTSGASIATTSTTPSTTGGGSTGASTSNTSRSSSWVSLPEAQKWRKDLSQRIFVGRSLKLEKIKFYGFDMDYTLANYKTPQYEALLFDRTIERLIHMSYPEEIKQLKYDSNFPVRGLWFDRQYGNLLKVDGSHNILIGIHGTKFMKPQEIEEFYPNKFLNLDEKRIHVMNTLFNLPDMYLLAKLVDFFDNLSTHEKTNDKTGVRSGEAIISYKSIVDDVVKAVEWVHVSGGMKDYILQNIEKYIHPAEELRTMMLQLRISGAKTFLLTNSEYKYTHGVMTYLAGHDWPQLFDIAIVDAKKPSWFTETFVFRQVDTTTGTLKMDVHVGPIKYGNIYSGGSCDGLKKLMKFRGKDVLYVGDHIFGDVLKSKKIGWRTFLIVPELNPELFVWTQNQNFHEMLQTYDERLGELYNLDSTKNDQRRATIDATVKAIRKVTNEMNQAYGLLGSMFRSGSRTTFFATQVERYADLYSSTCYNLIHYPKFYFFRARMLLLPHELAAVDKKSKMSNKKGVGLRKPGFNLSPVESSVDVAEDSSSILSTTTTQALTVEPPVCTISSAGGKSKHKLFNQSSSRLAYKFKLSNNSNYGVNLISGFLKVGGIVDFEITRKAGKSKGDKLVIMFNEAPADATDASKLFEANAPKSKLTGEFVLNFSADE